MDISTVTAPAKINLTLDILGKRTDGYHKIESIFQAVSLCDVLTFKKLSTGIKVTTDHASLPVDERNLVYQAARLMYTKFSLAGGIQIDIKKNIPLGAGLGGGSSDAAAVIKALQRMHGVETTKEELLLLASKIGSDVPFFVEGGTAVVAGRGEHIWPVPDMPTRELLLVLFPFELSTATVFAKWDSPPGNNTRRALAALYDGDWQGMEKFATNGLQEAAFICQPKIEVAYKLLMANGFSPVHISGSGPSLVVYSKDKEKVERILAPCSINVLAVKTLKKDIWLR